MKNDSNTENEIESKSSTSTRKMTTAKLKSKQLKETGGAVSTVGKTRNINTERQSKQKLSVRIGRNK